MLAVVAAVAVGARNGHRAEKLPAPPYAPATAAVKPARVLAGKRPRTGHFEYLVLDGSFEVRDIDHGQKLVERVALPATSAGVRGATMAPHSRILYVSYGGDGAGFGHGSLLAFDLVSQKVLWQRDYPTGIDSMAITPDGKTIYMPVGEAGYDHEWLVIRASDGYVTTQIVAGTAPHNTVVSLDGTRVYLGGRDGNELEVADTKTNQIVQKIGPMKSGVRPFTINKAQTLAYTTATGFLGFQVSSITTGKVLYTVTFKGFSWNPDTFSSSAPSHGISLSPDEREVWVIDGPNSYVHVFDVSGVPAHPPVEVADLKLAHGIVGKEVGCPYDCNRSGWVQHSRDGRFVYIGDSGDVFSTKTRKIVAYLPAMRETRKTIEIDWQGGVPVATTTRQGLGYGKR